MLVSLAACGSKTAKDAEITKEPVVTESGGISSVTEENGADSEIGEAVAADNESAPEETENSIEHMEDNTIKIGAGDIILYQGNSLVIYYDTNSWNFTRIGQIEGVTGEELLDAFGSGDVTVTFSLE